jgi:hypothetical protein
MAPRGALSRRLLEHLLRHDGETIGNFGRAVERLQNAVADLAAVDARLPALRDEFDPPITRGAVGALSVFFMRLVWL